MVPAQCRPPWNRRWRQAHAIDARERIRDGSIRPCTGHRAHQALPTLSRASSTSASTLLGLVGATVRGLDGRDARSDWERPSSTEDLVLFYDKAAAAARPSAAEGSHVRNGGCLYADVRTSAGRTTTTTASDPASAATSSPSASSIWTKTRPSAWTSETAISPSSPRPRVALRRGDRLGAVARARDAGRSAADPLHGGGRVSRSRICAAARFGVHVARHFILRVYRENPFSETPLIGVVVRTCRNRAHRRRSSVTAFVNCHCCKIR